MSNVLADDKHHQIVALGRLGWSLRRIERTTGVRRETISGYLKAVGIVVRGRGRRRESKAKPAISIAAVSTDSGGANPPISEAESTESGEAKAATRAEVSTDSVPSPRPARAPRASACEPYRELIAEALHRGRNAMAIWQDLVDDHGFTARYASVRRFVVTLRGTSSPDARVVITTAPGEEGQVDYGDGPMVRHPQTGKYRRTRLFVLTLGYSRKAVRLLVWQSSTQIWAELHERAFRQLGGTVRVIVLDNLKEGVLTPDIYDPALNPLYRDVLAHYGVVALPCRVGDPDRKGKVEAGVGHAKKTPLRGLRFETIEAAQAYLDRWEAHWADTRIHGTTKRQVAEMFAEEHVALGPLPLEPFRYYRFGVRTVHLDGCVESRRPITVRRPAGSAAASTCSGMIGRSASSIPRQAGCCGNTSAPRAAGIALRTPIVHDARHAPRSRCSPPPSTPAPRSGRCAITSMAMRAPRASAASSGSSPSRRNMARPSSTMPRKPRSISASRRIASSAGTSNAARRCP